MDNKESKQELISNGALGILMGLSLILAGIVSGRQAHIAWNPWPFVDGVVVKSAVQELSVPLANRGMPIYQFAPKVELRYRVNGKEFLADAPSIYITGDYDQAAGNVLQLYATGTHHLIRYNPSDPPDIRFGAIDIGSLAFSFLLLFTGVVLSELGTMTLLRGFVRPAEPAAATEMASEVLPIDGQARRDELTATIYCAACGRPVKPGDDSCPNCLKSLRAA